MRTVFPPVLWCLVAIGSLCVADPLGNMDPWRATKEKPYVNSLAMRFVPVEIPGSPVHIPLVLFSVWDTRVQDYAAYAKARKVNDAWTLQQMDGVPVGRDPNDPVVGVTWDEARAFCAWLTEKEMAQGKLPMGWKYRLPTDEEWSRAVGLPPEPGATPMEKSGKTKWISHGERTFRPK